MRLTSIHLTTNWNQSVSRHQRPDRDTAQRKSHALDFATWRNSRPEPVDYHMKRTVRYGLIPKSQGA